MKNRTLLLFFILSCFYLCLPVISLKIMTPDLHHFTREVPEEIVSRLFSLLLAQGSYATISMLLSNHDANLEYAYGGACGGLTKNIIKRMLKWSLSLEEPGYKKHILFPRECLLHSPIPGYAEDLLMRRGFEVGVSEVVNTFPTGMENWTTLLDLRPAILLGHWMRSIPDVLLPRVFERSDIFSLITEESLDSPYWSDELQDLLVSKIPMYPNIDLSVINLALAVQWASYDNPFAPRIRNALAERFCSYNRDNNTIDGLRFYEGLLCTMASDNPPKVPHLLRKLHRILINEIFDHDDRLLLLTAWITVFDTLPQVPVPVQNAHSKSILKFVTKCAIVPLPEARVMAFLSSSGINYREFYMFTPLDLSFNPPFDIYIYSDFELRRQYYMSKLMRPMIAPVSRRLIPLLGLTLNSPLRYHRNMEYDDLVAELDFLIRSRDDIWKVKELAGSDGVHFVIHPYSWSSVDELARVTAIMIYSIIIFNKPVAKFSRGFCQVIALPRESPQRIDFLNEQYHFLHSVTHGPYAPNHLLMQAKNLRKKYFKQSANEMLDYYRHMFSQTLEILSLEYLFRSNDLCTILSQ